MNETTTKKEVNEIEVNDAVLENGSTRDCDKSKCVPGELCQPVNCFEMIEECQQCGKLM